MTPDDLSQALAMRLDEDRIRASVERSVQASMKGLKARGHQMSMKGTTVRIFGPAAPAVAQEVHHRMQKAAKAALRTALL